MVKFLRNIFFVFFFAGISFAQNISVTAGTDSTNYLIGDYINYRLVVRYASNLEVSVPPAPDSLQNIELIREGNVVENQEDGETVRIYNYTFAVYDSMDVVIPPVTVTYKASGQSFTGSAESNPVQITVHSLPVDPSAEIKDIKQPLTIPLNWLLILWIVLIILILLLIGYLIYRYFKKKKQDDLPIKRKAPPIPVHIRTLSLLDELEKKELWQKEKIKEYHTEITFIIRDYFERRFYFPALEVTSGEIIIMLKRYIASQEVIDQTEKFFENADLVKFAKYKPLPEVNKEMMKQAYFIVEQTKPEERRESVTESEAADVH